MLGVLLSHPRRSYGSAVALAAVMAATLLVPPPAHATRYYVRSAGNDANDGRSFRSAWRTIGKANRSVHPGDSVLVSAGTYAEIPAPAVDGTGWAPSQRITFVGVPKVPTRVTIPGGDLTKSYVYVTGFRSTGTYAMVGPAGGVMVGSVFDAVNTDGGTRLYRARRCKLTRCQIGNGERDAGFELNTMPPFSPTELDTLESSTLLLRHPTAPEGQCFSLRGDIGHVVRGCVFRDNTIQAVIYQGPLGCGGTSKATYLAYSADNQFRNNTWMLYDDTGCPGQRIGWYIRDLFVRNTFENDRILMQGGGLRGQFSGSGNETGQYGGNRWTDCDIRNLTQRPPDGMAIVWQNSIRGDTLQRCLFVSPTQPIAFRNWIGGDSITTVIDHCTFVGLGTGPVVKIGEGTAARGRLRMTSNLFYAMNRGAGSLVHWTWRSGDAQRVTSNWNHYSRWDSCGAAAGSIHAIDLTTCDATGGNCVGIRCSRPDSIPWRTVSGNQDASSQYSWRTHRPGVLLAGGTSDSTSLLDVTATLGCGSGAIGVGENGTNAGAYQPGPPTAVTDLTGAPAATDSSLVFRFSAPASDTVCACEEGCRYEIAISPTPIITAADFASALKLPPPAPGPPSFVQTFTVAGLAPGEQRYARVRAAGRGSEWSPTSNQAVAATTKDWSGAMAARAREAQASAARGPSLVPLERSVVVLPNPTSHGAVVLFGLPHATTIELRVMDIQGREVAVLAAGPHEAGVHRATCPAISPGSYFVVLDAEGRRLTRKMVVMR